MITIEDSVFGEKFHSSILSYCQKDADFKDYKLGDKVFYCDTENLDKIQNQIIEHLESKGNKVKPVLSFYRMATEDLDNDWGIHCDLKIFGEEPTHACIYYISSSDRTLNGTAVWKHKTYGRYCPEITDEEFDRLIIEDYNSFLNWNVDFVISGVEDRLITYPANMFHSKYPNIAWGKSQKDCRLIFCMFYSIHG